MRRKTPPRYLPQSLTIQTPIMTDYLMPTQLFCILWNFSVSFTLVSLELVIGNQFTRKLSYFVITQRRYSMLKDISVWLYDPGMLIKKKKNYHLNKFPNHSHHVEEDFYSFITVIGDQGTSTLICFWGQEDWGGMSFCSNKIEAFLPFSLINPILFEMYHLLEMGSSGSLA